MWSLYIQPNCYKKVYFFSLNIRISGKNMNFGDKKIKKVNFTKTKK